MTQSDILLKHLIADCPMRNQIETEINRKLKLLQIETEINRKLKLLENVETVEISITAMDQKDRTAVMEKAREKARENAQPTNVDPRTRVIAIGSGKGGVGKSTLSANIARYLGILNTKAVRNNWKN